MTYNISCPTCGNYQINSSDTKIEMYDFGYGEAEAIKCPTHDGYAKVIGEVTGVKSVVEGNEKDKKLFWMLRPKKHREDIMTRKILSDGKIGRFRNGRRVA